MFGDLGREKMCSCIPDLGCTWSNMGSRWQNEDAISCYKTSKIYFLHLKSQGAMLSETRKVHHAVNWEITFHFFNVNNHLFLYSPADAPILLLDVKFQVTHLLVNVPALNSSGLCSASQTATHLWNIPQVC